MSMYSADRGARCFFQQYYDFEEILFTCDRGELGPENDTPLPLGSRRSDLSAQVASQVPLGPENGPDDESETRVFPYGSEW